MDVAVEKLDCKAMGIENRDNLRRCTQYRESEIEDPFVLVELKDERIHRVFTKSELVFA